MGNFTKKKYRKLIVQSSIKKKGLKLHKEKAGLINI